VQFNPDALVSDASFIQRLKAAVIDGGVRKRWETFDRASWCSHNLESARSASGCIGGQYIGATTQSAQAGLLRVVGDP
jgi:hypothetical protein